MSTNIPSSPVVKMYFLDMLREMQHILGCLQMKIG
ncbi:hypothetical protein LINPERPRIM_LOCUS31021 [Linum perenne]